MPEFTGNPEHLEIVKKGPEYLNTWREKNPDQRLNLSGAYLSDADLIRADLRGADLRGAILSDAKLIRTDLRGADLSGANLIFTVLLSVDLGGANLRGANLSFADLNSADLSRADLLDANLSAAKLGGANLSDANLRGADLSGANLSRANLNSTDIKDARLFDTIFSQTDLSQTKNLETCIHHGPSSIDFQTLQASHPLPMEFLRGCGLPDDYIKDLPKYFDQTYYSLFISHSSQDKPFAQKLYQDLQNAGIRCWFDSEDMKAGRKLHEQLYNAIDQNDRLMLVLSQHSMASKWVKTEIAKARQREEKENLDILFPIRLVPMQDIKDWDFFDADLGWDSAKEIREYYIPSFENRQDEDAYQKSLQNLIRALKKAPS